MADNRYRITERVAAGGMAEVFRGVAESMRGFKKNIAIKRILPALTKNKKFVAMFLDEARLSLSLQHANIVQVFDIGHTEDTYFIVMEYVDGVDLKAILDWRRRVGKRIPVAHSLYIITEICKGLSYAHELPNPETDLPLGIVHRDVSPPNVLLSKQGEIKVVDFGLAKATSQVEVTDPGVVKGKMSYLSPEAARGEEVDHRADIFAVGILLYEMLTGKRLFYGETDYQTVELVRNAKVPPLRPQNSQVEPELEDIVRKALSKRPEDRYQSATDLQDALAQYSYSRGLKVISRDIAELVRQCLDDKRMQSGEGRKGSSIIDHLLQGDLDKFTSVGFDDAGAQPLSADELGPQPEPPPPTAAEGDFIDPRAWAEERPSSPDAAELRALESRRTSRDLPPTPAPPPAQRRAERMRVPTGESRAPRNSPPVASPAESTPGPEALANILEPTPGPHAPAVPRPGSAAPRTAHAPSHAGRNFLIGALIGIVILGAAAAVFVSKRGGAGGAPHATQPAS
ncbi:MAG TPA: protein kinase [Polyangia bacterium]|nr:protein kinase [Polyangia bacterium]